MRDLRFGITGGFNQTELEQIRDEALVLLRDTGMVIEHEGIVELLRRHKGVNVSGTTITFEPDLVEKYIGILGAEHSQESEPSVEPETLRMGGSVSCMRILDLETREFRPPTSLDLVDSIKLHEGLGIDYLGVSPVTPTDIPDAVRAVQSYRISCENTPRPAANTFIASYEEAEFLHEMEQVTGKKANMDVQFILSPMRFNYESLDMVYRSIVGGKFLIDGCAVPMPMAGASAPLFIPGGFVQATAESLAGAITLRLLSDNKLGHFTERVDPFDMVYASISIGSPEWILMRLLGRQVHGFLFPGSRLNGAFRTLSKEPDSQAAAERSLSVFVEALVGATFFTAGGQMSVDEIYSPEQLVLDEEILRYVEHVVRGFKYDAQPGISIETIREVGPGGSFLTHPSTLENMKKMYWEPRLFKHWMFGTWQAEGAESIRDRARDRARAAMKSHEYEPDPNVTRELERICQSAQKALL